MTDQEQIRATMRLYFDTPGGDVEHAAEIYHEDAVLEFPQSGERFEGRDNFTAWRGQYPAQVGFDVRRITIADEMAIVELTASYDGGPTMYGVSMHEFRDGRVAYERIYVAEGWEAPDWRAQWRSAPPVPGPEGQSISGS